MYITRVRLENIKRHKDIERDFEPGINAIYGPNGAGKTSFIEAIGFALFDYHPYSSRSELIRKNARKATIWLEFVSALDQQLYMVERQILLSGGGQYRLYDRNTSTLICENKDEVLSQLRLLMKVHPDTNLPKLFGSILGVPQGTMTAVFLSTKASEREQVFDPLLEVEIYKRTHLLMRQNYLRQLEIQLQNLQNELERLREKVDKIDAVQSEAQRLGLEIDEDNRALSLEKARAPDLGQQIALLRELHEQLAQLREQQKLVEHTRQQQQAQLADIERRYRIAEKAQSIVLSTQSGYQLYREAESRLSELYRSEQQYRQMRNDLQRLEQDKAKLGFQLQEKETRLTELAKMAEEHERLQPLLTEQRDLRQREQKAFQAQAHLEKLQKEIAEVTAELQEQERAEREKAQLIDQLVLLQPLLVRDQELAQKLTDITSQGRDLGHQIERWEERYREHCREQDKITQIDADIIKMRKLQTIERQKLEELGRTLRPLAAQMPIFEVQISEQQRATSALESQHERDRQFSNEVSGGICPYLQQPCRNVPPNQRLDDFIIGQIRRCAELLQDSEQKLADLKQKYQQAKAAQDKLHRELPIHQSQSDSYEREIQRYGEERANCESRLASHTDCTAEIERIKAQREELRKQYKLISQEQKDLQPKIADATDLKTERDWWRELQRKNQQLRNRLQQKNGESQDLTASASEIEALRQRLKEIEQPCSQVVFYARCLEEQPLLLKTVEDLRFDIEAKTKAIEQKSKDIKQFSQLESELAEWQKELESKREDHKLYIENQQSAQNLPELLSSQANMQRELEQKLEQEQQLKVRLAELEPQFNAEAFADLQRAERECLRCIERLETGLRHKRENCDRLHTQIAELTEAQKLLNAKQLQLQRLEQIWECSEFLRSIYDRARPEITRLLIESISEEASRIFAQLVDNYRLRLRWIDEEKDRYALIVDEDGQSRSFANLSGGEQMSAALALRMALIKELSSLRLAFFDEPTAHMDSERRRNLASQIAEIKGFEQIFVISHDDTFESQIHNVVRIP